MQLRCYKEQRENKDTATIKFMDTGVGIDRGSGGRRAGEGMGEKGGTAVSEQQNFENKNKK